MADSNPRPDAPSHPDLQRAAAALSESEDRFQILAEAAFEGIVFTEQGVLLDCNDQMVQLVGRPRADLVGRPVSEFIAPEHRQRVAEARRANKTEVYEHLLLHPARGAFPVEARSRMAHIGGRDLRVTAIRDVTERKRAEEALHANREKLDSIFRAAPSGIGVVRDRVLLDVNERVCAMTGYSREELVGRSSRCLYPSEEEFETVGREKYAQIRKWGTGTVETRWQRKDGAIIDVLLSSSPIDLADWSVGVTFTALDITERRRALAEQEKLRAQLVHAQKLESIGRLAGGVAHDFNNMLQAILGNVALALEEGSGSPGLQEHLQEIQKAATRSSDLTRQLLAFARKQTVSPRTLDLNDAVAGLVRMLKRLIGEDIDLAWEPGHGLWPIRIDPSQVDQALTNLAVNARDAIHGGGRITVRTTNVTIDERHPHVDGSPGDYVRLSVSDTGDGIDAETQNHLFEPFFTTKGVGQGTGLGLATVYGIVKQNGGFIGVESEPGRGTTLTLHLPRTSAAGEPTSVPARDRLLAGTETVLLVEDEEQVLALMRTVLRRDGYTVLAASMPDAALALAKDHTGPIHLLLTDIVMPGMNGRELLSLVATIKPGIRCLFVSGYTSDVIAQRGVLEAGVQFLQKPFGIPALLRKVREVLA